MFKIISCINKKNAIGLSGKTLYTIKNDMANFKSMTMNNVVIMGRKTFESISNGKPLENRINIILTSNPDYSVNGEVDNVYIVYSIKDVIELCDAFFSDKELFVIGGEFVYKEFLDSGLVDEMRLTIVNDNADGDTFFPQFNTDEWQTYYKSMAQVSTNNKVEKSFYYQILKKK